MSTDFEWVTDEESDWPELTPPPPKPRRSIPWRWLLLLLLVLAGGGAWLAGHMQQRLETATHLVTQDVRAAYTLYAQAAQRQDVDLIKTVVSGSSPVWWQTQLKLLDENLLLGRWSMELLTPEDGRVPEIKTVIPAPDLTEAEVVTRQPFIVSYAHGRSQTITLEMTTLLRRGSDRWLVAAPDSEFWGEWQVANGASLSIIYPERDKEQAEKLLSGLEAELARACRELALPCPAASNYTIRLDSDPASLLQVADPVAMLTRQPILNLPAPTLVGRPIDAAGERALLRAYAAHFITAVLVDHTSLRCCEQGLFHQALIDYQLAQLDLRPWPLQDSHYQAMIHEPMVGMAGLGRFWHEPPVRPISGTAQPQIYSMVAVLLNQEPMLNPYVIQQRLAVMDNYQNWIGSLAGFGFLNQDFQRAWLKEVQTHLSPMTVGDTAVSLPPPAQDLLLLCGNAETNTPSQLYRYSWQNDSWTMELADRRLQFLAGLPGETGVLLQEQMGRERLVRVFSWVDGREQTVAIYPAQSTVFRVEPVGEDVLFYVFKFDENSAEFNLLDLDNCQEEGCDVAGWSQPPVWSPSGSWLVETNEAEELWLRDATSGAVVQVRHGRAPFWLSNVFYGFVTTEALVITPLTEAQGPRRYSIAPLESAVLAVHPTADWTIHAITAHPGTNGVFVAVAYTEQNADAAVSGTMLLHYDLSGGEANVLFEGTEQFGPYHPLTFSPDGRWLNMQSYNNHDFDWQLDIFNLETEQHMRYRSAQNIALPGFDWSADGRWLLRIDDDFIHITAPEAGFDQLLFYDFATCNFATWVQ
ncbi:MAG: hypothetical protein KJ069_29880 [Anaerolineae bacterium]|nr:hypothetical protein [Anaerolineae bacterium]